MRDHRIGLLWAGQRARHSTMPPPALVVAVVLGCITLGGCAAMRMNMRYGTLESQTKLSESIFLELRSDLPPTVYLTETSSADSTISVRPELERQLAAMGYVLVDAPDSATYVMQVNHRQFIEVELSEDQTLGDALSSAFTAGFGVGIAADVAGAGGDVAAGAGLAAGAVGFVLDANTKHIAHLLTTDVRLTETVPGCDGVAALREGVENVECAALQLRSHETELVSGASKVNLEQRESLPAILEGTSQTLARLLPPRAGGTPR